VIKFSVFIAAFLLFFAILTVHIMLWRLVRPMRQIGLLFLVFVIVPTMLFGSAVALIASGIIAFLGVADTGFAFLLYIAMAGVYIQTYPAIQAGAPSLFIMYLIGRSTHPVPLADIRTMMDGNRLINDRIDDLISDGFITVLGNERTIALTAKGRLLSGAFMLYRRSLGLGIGEG